MKFYRQTSFVVSLVIVLIATRMNAQSVEQTKQGVQFSAQNLDIKIEFYSNNIVRVYKTPKGVAYDKKSLSVIKSPEKTTVSFEQKGNNTVLKSNSIQVDVNPVTGGISFYDNSGKLLLKDKDYGTQFSALDDAGKASYTVREGFLLD